MMFNYNSTTGEIFLYDAIGPEWYGMIGTESLQQALSEITGRVTLRINSPGGAVDEAIAMYGMLERHPGGVDVVVDSLAASAASFIALVGDTVTIARGGAMMVHSPLMMFVAGNAKELRKTADLLDTYQARVVGYYTEKMSITAEEVNAIMDAETWYTAEEAIAAKLADSIDGEAVTPAAIGAAMFRKTPEKFVSLVNAGDRTPYPVARELARLRHNRNKFTK